MHPESYFAGMLQELERLLPGDGPLVDRYDAFRQQFIIPPEPPGARLRSRDRRMPRAHAAARAAAGRRELHRRVRHEQAVERLQLVSGQLPQPDPGQHRPADLHRSRDRSRVPRGLSGSPRLQRAAREASRARSRLGRVHGLPAVLAAVADRRGHRELRHRGRVSRATSAPRSSATCSFRWPASIRRRPPPTRACRRSSIGCRTPATKRRASTSTASSIATQAAAWLAQYAMMSPARAEQRTRFFDTYRSYVINYNLGKDLVKQYVESRAASPPSRRSGGRSSSRLLASPRLPSGLPLMAVRPVAAAGRRAARDVRRHRHLSVRSAAARPLRSPAARARCRLRRRPQPGLLARAAASPASASIATRRRSTACPRAGGAGSRPTCRSRTSAPARSIACRGTTPAWTPSSAAPCCTSPTTTRISIGCVEEMWRVLAPGRACSSRGSRPTSASKTRSAPPDAACVCPTARSASSSTRRCCSTGPSGWAASCSIRSRRPTSSSSAA